MVCKGHAVRRTHEGRDPLLPVLGARAGLPPIRLHDLHHGAATLALADGVDIKVVSEQLGDPTSTRDTYTSVVKDLHRTAANAVANKITSRRRGTG